MEFITMLRRNENEPEIDSQASLILESNYYADEIEE